VRLARAGLLTAAVVVVDQLTKAWVVATMPRGSEREVIPGLLHFVHTRNRGIAFGLLGDLGPLAYSLLLAGVVVIILVLGYQLYRTGADGLTTAALSLVLGGALGNLGDRLLRGEVVDFLDVFVTTGGHERHWPAFNLADAAITVGAILIVLAELLLARKRRHAPHAD
jgi:signal peptidase II